MNTPVSQPNTPISSQPAARCGPALFDCYRQCGNFRYPRLVIMGTSARGDPGVNPCGWYLGMSRSQMPWIARLTLCSCGRSTATLLMLKAGWQEQQVYVWGSTEQGSAVSLIHSVLLRANRDELRPNLSTHAVPSLRVSWTQVREIKSGQRMLDADVLPAFQMALHTLRAQIQRDPEIVLRHVADMGTTQNFDWRQQHFDAAMLKETRPLGIIKEPAPGDGILTLAEASLLYRAFFPPEEQIDLSNLRRRFLATNRLEALDEERPVRGRELDWRRVSRAYRYHGS